MKVYTDIEQGTPEWHALRLGKATASEFSSILAKGEGKTRAKYLRTVVAEALTGKPVESYRNAHTDRGHEQEPMARWAYELLTGYDVEQVAFVEHDALFCGCSPDGLVGRKRGAEIKSVIATVQVETILGGGYPSGHRAQIQGSMWVTGFDKWDFVSYCPDMPKEHLRLYVHTVERDEVYIQALEAEVRRFLDDRDRLLAQLLGEEQDVEAKLRKSLAVA